MNEKMQKIEEIKTQIRPILKKYGIRKAALFGSVVRGKSGANDLDLLVKIERRISLLEFIGIQQELEDALNMNVDLVEYDTIKPELREDILRDEEPVL
jgi:predicted nucleotidyltransferase